MLVLLAVMSRVRDLISFEKGLGLEAFVFGHRWLSWKVCKWILLLLVKRCIAWHGVVHSSLMLLLVLASINLVQGSSERIWG